MTDVQCGSQGGENWEGLTIVQRVQGWPIPETMVATMLLEFSCIHPITLITHQSGAETHAGDLILLT